MEQIEERRKKWEENRRKQEAERKEQEEERKKRVENRKRQEEEQKKREAERQQQETEKRYVAAREREQIVFDDKKADTLYAAEALRTVAKEFRCLGAYLDSLQRAEACEQQATHLEKEAEAEKIRQAEEKQAREIAEYRGALEREKAALQNELSNLNGLFTGKRRKEIKARIANIELELTKCNT